jgi:hypothetical protein
MIRKPDPGGTVIAAFTYRIGSSREPNDINFDEVMSEDSNK